MQRALIYKRSNHASLLSNPPTITVGDEQFVLKPLDRVKDEPGTTKVFTQVMKGMQETGQWGNMEPFLRSLVIAKRKLTPAQKGKVIRLLAEAGKFGKLGLCLENVRYTELKMDSWVVGREVVYALGKAVVNNKEKAKKLGNRVWELLYQERHEAEEARSHVVMLGGLMLVRAVNGEKEEILRLARLVAARWPAQGLGGLPDRIWETEEDEESVAREKIPSLVVAQRGLKLGAEVLGDTEEGRYIAGVAEKVEGWCDDMLDIMETFRPGGTDTTRGAVLYSKLREVRL